jgi:cyclopropane fatty-acyl-phospholipid synthase-like methyltransferase
MSAGFFNTAYSGTPPWDIGRAQPAIERLAEAGEIEGPVLDVGCGTGENALYLAARGFEVTGVDVVEIAVRAARRKARARRLPADFRVHDVLDLAALGRRFRTVVDSGLFHTLDDDERPRFRDALAAVLLPGGRYYMLAFSEHETRPGGPRRVTQEEIRGEFDRHPFRVLSIEPAEMATNFADGGRRCWLARIERLADGR